MKAIIYYNDNFSFREIPTPELNLPTDVVVSVQYAGLCGSDIHRIKDIQNKIILNPPVLGHEISGVVKKVGSDVSTIKVGDKVFVEPIIWCGSCDRCNLGLYQFCRNLEGLGKTLNGGFSQYVCIQEKQLYKLPENLSLKEAVLIDLISVCIHGRNLLNGFKDKKVAIIGDGPVGVASYLLASQEASKVFLINKHELDDNYNCINYKDKARLNSFNNYFDIVIETVGRETAELLNLAISLIDIRGEILVQGVFPPNFQAGLNVRALFYKEGRVRGSNSYCVHNGNSEVIEAIELMSKAPGSFLPLVSHTLPLNEFTKGVELFLNKKTSGAKKILFLPNANNVLDN